MAQIVEVNGEPVEFPDDMTDDQIANVIKQQAAPQGAVPGLTQEQIDQKLPINRPTNMGAMPNGAPLPYGTDPAMLQAMNKSNAEQNQQNADLRQNPQFMQQVAEASNNSMLSNAWDSLKHTVNEFGTGGEELIDKYLPNVIAQPLNYRFGGKLPYNSTAEERMAARKAEMEGANQEQAARTIGDPIGSTVGAMLPYFGTGAAFERGINTGLKAASPITQRILDTTLAKAGALEGAPGMLNTIGESANTMLARRSSAPTIPSDFRTRLAYGAKAPLIGAGEGTLNYNQTAAGGAAASAAGVGMAAVGPLRMMDKVENVRDANGKALIKEMDRAGFSLTPGVRTGNRQMQTEEAGMKNSDVLGDYYHQQVTRPNQQKMTEMAGDAIGLNGKNRDTFSADELSAHMDNLRSQYSQLEASTTGKFTPAHMKEAGDVLTELKPTPTRNTSPDDAARYAKVKSITDQIKAESVPGAGVSGINNRSFDGSQYQGWRKRIQDEASQAFQQGDTRLGDALNRLKANLDSALETGMGKGKAADWKDLNERYAMTNLLMKHGLTPSGAVDPLGITSKVMSGDEAIRTLTGKGGRIKQLQKIARYNDVLKNVEGGSLTGLGTADYTASRDLGKMPFRYKLPLYARSAGAYRLSQWPAKLGFGPLASLKTGRAFAQTRPLEQIATAGSGMLNDLRDWYRSDEEQQ